MMLLSGWTIGDVAIRKSGILLTIHFINAFNIFIDVLINISNNHILQIPEGDAKIEYDGKVIFLEIHTCE